MEADRVVAEIVAELPKPWGLWATLGFSLLVVAVWQLVGSVVLVIYAGVAAGVSSPAELTPELVEGFRTNGMVLSVVSWVSLPFVLGLIVLLVKLRRRWSVRDYLAMHRVTGKTLLAWLGLALLLEGSLAILSAAGRPTKTDYMIQVYETAGFLPLLWATLLVEAPLFEELFFRGFMFQGIQQSRLGDRGAILLTALAFTAVHVQYDAPQLAGVFVSGLLLGAARRTSGSVYTTMAMHALGNLICLIQVHSCFVGAK